MRYFTLRSNRIFAAVFVLITMLCGKAWGADVVISVTFNSTNKPQNGITLSSGGQDYGTLSCNTASSNRAIIRNTSSLTFAATRTGWTIKSITLTWRGQNDPASTSVLTITGGTFNSLTSITGSSTTVVVGSENDNNNYQVSAVSVTFTEETICVAPTSVGIDGTMSYTEGETISLMATPDGGTGTPSYQWYKGGTAAGNKITGATSDTYTKASCITGDAGDYYCEVSTGSTCSTFSDVYPISVSPVPTTKTIYLKPGVWKTGEGNERFAVYCFNATGNEWYDMSLFVQNDCDGTVYKAEVSLDYTTYIFCRMNPGTTENNFNDGVKWNQTDDQAASGGEYAEVTGWGSGNSPCNWNHKPYSVCVTGTWLAFKGETITLTATCACATHFQWYHGSDPIEGATSATYTKTNCTRADGGNYYCKAWGVAGESEAKSSNVYGVKVPYLAIQTGGGGDLQDLDFVRTSPSDETATCERYLGVAWDYEMLVKDGIDARGNTGTMTSNNCTDWTMDQLNNDKWCRINTTKEGTYHFTLSFSNSTYAPVKLSATYPPMVQTPGLKVYIENTPAMQERGWNNSSIYYRIGKGKYDDGDDRNWTAAQLMTLVPGTARYLYTTTPDWGNNFWVWHIANNAGWVDGTYSIYKTKTEDSYAITESSNFNGDEVTTDRTIYLNSTSGGYGEDPINSNCQFYGYTHSDGMILHNASVGSTTNGQIRVTYTHHDGSAQISEAYTERTLNDLAHTCILTITAVPDNGYRCTSLQVNGVDFASGTTHILDANATITATFDHATYTVTLHENEGTINSGNVTSYMHGTGATLPTDVTKDNKEFSGWYDNEACTGDPIDVISTTEWGNKEYWAKWVNEVPKVTYILGSCYVNGSKMWTQGSDGSVKAWLFQKGATVAENNVKATTDISISSNSTGGVYFNTKDITLLDNESYWNTSSGSNRAIKALKVSGGGTITFNLSGMIASQIAFYVFPASKDAYSIDLTVNGATTNRAIAANQQHKWHKYQYKGGNYSGEFSITSNSKESRVVVIVEVPLVTVTFDKNHASATGTMENISVPKGSTFALEENAYELAGSNFLGWTEDAPGAGLLIADGADYTTEADVTLYAQWEEIIQTTITLDATGAYNRYTSSVVATYNKPMPEIAVLPKRANGYVFDGYYTEPNGGGTQYYTGLGASVQNWDKTDPTYTLYAKWLEPCDLVPTLTKVSPGVTIWDGQKVDVGVVKLTCEYEVEGITYDLQSVSPVNPINGCTFEYFDEYVHLRGVPDVGNTEVLNIPVTFTMANSCDPARTYTISTSIRIYPEGQKPKIAFIITGTKGGAFNAYSASDASSCDDLVTYLGNYFDITYVNGYASKDEATLATYYDQYDLMVVTDFLNTQEGYTNALGTLIDKKPILSFEAYVAGLSNWHIGSNPKDPKPKVQDMKVLCAGHAIFKNAKYEEGDVEETVVVRADTTVNVLASLSSAEKAKGLQGFTINEAPDFVFLATIEDANNNRDLIVCCERQVTFPARLLLYGINFYEMPNLSKAGKIVMRQMIEYLLMTDETKVADCSLVFDNGAGNSEPGGGDHLWSNPKNWAPGYNIVPTPYHPTRIIAECWVNVDDAHAGSVKINKGRDEHDNVVDGKLIVKPYGGLTIAGLVATVKDTRYASPITIKAEDLLIEADEDNNGAFVYGNKESDVRATVQYYSRGEGARTNSPVWQYMGTPFQSGHSAISMYRDAWMCRWTTASDKTMGGLWQWVENDDVLIPFEGYCITQEAKKTYTFAGKLNAPVTKTLILDNREPDDGFAFVANSWTAPIKIQEMADEDFTNAERAIYIYHTGTYAEWTANGNPAINATSAAVTLPGQYAVIPIHSSPYISGADSVIPAMQGFFVKTSSADAKLKLVYNRTVYDAKYFKTSTQPMRAPSRYGAPELMLLTVLGKTSGGDRVHILERGDFSEEYADGWDGRKIAGDEAAPKLALVKEAGEMAVAALESADEHYLSFRAGQDTEYTFHFEYEGEPIYLYDQFTGEATLIETGNTYTFQATNSTAVKRFLLTKNPPRVPTALENTADRVQNTDQKFIQEGKLFIFHGGVIYDAQGKRVELRKEGAL